LHFQVLQAAQFISTNKAIKVKLSITKKNHEEKNSNPAGNTLRVNSYSF